MGRSWEKGELSQTDSVANQSAQRKHPPAIMPAGVFVVGELQYGMRARCPNGK